MNFLKNSKRNYYWINHVLVGVLYSFIVLIATTSADSEPVKILSPGNQTTFIGRNLTLFCDVRGDVRPIIWQLQNFTTSTWEDIPKSGTRIRYTTKSSPRNALSFDSMLISDTGLYRCGSGTRKNRQFSDPFYIYVQAMVSFVNPLRNRTVMWGTEVTLDCDVTGLPAPFRNWTKNGKPILDQVTGMQYSRPSLRINATDSAWYGCEAVNSHSEGVTKVSDSAYINVVDGQCQPYSGSVCPYHGEDVRVFAPVSVPQSISHIESTVLNLLKIISSSSSSSDKEYNSEANSERNDNCREMATLFLCAALLPICEKESKRNSTMMPVCRESCLAVRDKFCIDQWPRALQSDDKQSNQSQALFHSLPDCELLPEAGVHSDSYSQCTQVDFFNDAPQKITSNDSNATASEHTDPHNLMMMVENSVFGSVKIFIIIGISALLLFLVILLAAICVHRNTGKKRGGCHGSREYDIQVRSEESGTSGATASLVTRDDDLTIDVRLLPSNRSYRQPRSRQSTTASKQPVNRMSQSYDREVTSTSVELLDHLEFERNEIEWIKDIATGMYGRVFLASIPSINIPQYSSGILAKSTQPNVGNRLTTKSCTSALGGANSLKPSIFFSGFSSHTIDERKLCVVKMLEESEELVERFKSELNIVASVAHENVIKLLGVCLQGTPLCALYEHMDGMDLSGYLSNHRPEHFISRQRELSSTNKTDNITEVTLLAIARQIAAAMVYVSSQHIVHRDIATRNCLVSLENSCTLVRTENTVGNVPPGQHAPLVKLSDFGLAVRLDKPIDSPTISSQSAGEYFEGFEGEMIPIRWLSPESIGANRYSTESDVWSFGVMLWEVFSYAAQPYPDIDPEARAEDVARAILDGYIMERPHEASVAVYDVMCNCWSYDPICRPTFDHLYSKLCELEMSELERGNS